MNFDVFKGKRVLVTGSTGFKGSWLCTWLTELGANVSGLALPPAEDAPLFDQLKLRDRVDQHDGDIRDLNFVQRVLDRTEPEIVIHLAAQALVRLSYDVPKDTLDTNIGGGINLLEAIRKCDAVKALVFITSDKCYRNKEWDWGYRENDELGGPDPYSASKAAAELVFATYHESFFQQREGFQAATTRAGNVIGGGDFSKDRIIPDCIRALKDNKPIVVRNPISTRPWQHVMEPLSGYLAVAEYLLAGNGEGRPSWNFGPDAENVRTVKELADKAVDIWGSGSVDVQINRNAPHEAKLLMLISDKAKSILGWRPRWDFNEAVSQTIQWYKDVDAGEDPLEVTRSQIAAYMGGNK